MAAALVQTKTQNAGNYSNTNVAALSSSVTAGSLLVMGITCGIADTILTVADTQLNTWTLIDSDGVAGARQTFFYYAKNATAGSTTITVTFGVSQFPDSILTIQEWSGIDTSTPLDKSAKGHDGGYVQTHSTSATATTSQANELVVVVGGCDAQTPTWAAGSGYSNLAAQGGFDLYTSGVIESKVVAATGAQTGVFTTTPFVQGQAVVATFKITGAAAVGNSNFLAFM